MKFIFFDVDGTLSCINSGVDFVPESTRRTLTKLKEQGHIVAIATGRPYSSVKDIAKDVDIHYIVTDGGNGLVIHDQVQYVHPLDDVFVKRCTQEFIEKKIPFAYLSDPIQRIIKASPQMLAYQPIDHYEQHPICIDDHYDYTKEKAYKIFVSIYKGEEDLVSSINLNKIMRYHDHCLVIEPEDKYKGMKELVSMFNGKEEDMIFFGDGYNDLSVVKQVALSVAMGNAVDDLKKVATFVTKDILDDGIEYACRCLQLI